MISTENNKNTDSGDKLLKSLHHSHVIHTLIIEHQIILKTLSLLRDAGKKLIKMTEKEMESGIKKTILNLAQKVIGAEPHHQREEQALFPIMREFGIVGPTNVMEMEHKAIRDYKHKLLEAAQDYGKCSFKDYQSHMDFYIDGLTHMLEEHIYKENEILYPMALQTISDQAVWADMKKKCDGIGYCSFTPDFGNGIGKSNN